MFCCQTSQLFAGVLCRGEEDHDDVFHDLRNENAAFVQFWG